MSLNISNLQIAKELGLHQGDVQKMTEQLGQTVHNKKPKNQLKEEVECDEVYVVGDIKGNPVKLKKRPKRSQKPFMLEAEELLPKKSRQSSA